ncbi:MAG: SPOR domain-containing protein [Candidatus Omnitrophica bacterium]|nr:SPOR domain-containing protein [Candidatus Omnitrophota bacterium]
MPQNKTMSFFGNKNKSKENLHTLTEKEIQEKLYGHLRIHQSVIQDDTPVLKPKETLAVPPSRKETVLPKANSPLGVAAEDRMSRISEWADEETEVINKASKFDWHQNAADPSFAKKPAKTASKTKLPSQNILFSILKIVAVIISGTLKIFRAPIFRSKKFLTATGAVLFLVFVFFAIHALNVQREKAMTMPRKAVLSRPVATENVPPATPVSESASETAIRETQVSSPAAAPAVPVTRVPDTPAKPAVPPAADGAYVVQIATFAVATDAENLVKKFENENLIAFTKDLRRSTGKVYYSVFLGRYKNYQEAQRGLDLFRKKTIAKSFPDAFIRTLS